MYLVLLAARRTSRVCISVQTRPRFPPLFLQLRTSPSLARTSRFFLEPVLDALWDTLPDYGILVRLLPKDAWAADVMHGVGQEGVPPEFRGPSFQYVVQSNPSH